MRTPMTWAVTAAFLLGSATACGNADADTEADAGSGPTTVPSPSASDAASTTAMALAPAPGPSSTITSPPLVTTGRRAVPPGVRVGAEVLVERGFDLVQGRRVGLIANQSSLVEGTHLADLLHREPGVELVALFAPEHGFRGGLNGGVRFDDGTDAATGLPVFSLYGENMRPTPEMLDGVDVVVFDIQDVGARFYTFISTLGLSMQSAAEAGIPFVVLDRPNPVGGAYVGGFTRTADQESFIGQYPIPAAYGLTVGELALAIVAEGWLPGVAEVDLRVVPLRGWRREMSWVETDLPWRAPSAGLQAAEAALAYPGTVLFEATSMSYGIGTREPFLVFGAPWADGPSIAASLDGASLPGVRFEPVSFTPVPIPGWTETPRLEEQLVHGVRLIVEDPAVFRPVETGVVLLTAFVQHGLDRGQTLDELIDRPRSLDRLAGTTELRLAIEAGAGAGEIIAAWQDDVARFEAVRQGAMIYP